MKKYIYVINCFALLSYSYESLNSTTSLSLTEESGEDHWELKAVDSRDTFCRDLSPYNPFLAGGAWSSLQKDSYAQSCTENSFLNPSTSRREDLKKEYLFNIAVLSDPIALLYTEDNKYIWGSSFSSVFKVQRDGPMKLVDSIDQGFPVGAFLSTDGNEDLFHGAYSVLSSENVYYSLAGNVIRGYGDDPDRQDKIKLLHEMPLSEENNGGKKVGRALCLLYDGTLVLVSSDAHIRATSASKSRGFFNATPLQSMTNNVDEILNISNGLACDEKGGVYAVSDKYLHKMQWNSYNRSFTIAWQIRYATGASDNGTVDGNRLGAGSGSTPTLIGNMEEGLYVVITDGSAIMNIVVFDAKKGTLLDRMPVTFGIPNVKKTLSEQSVVASGMRLLVVNNTPRNGFSTNLTQSLGGVMNIGAIQSLANAAPAILAETQRGLEQFEFNPATQRLKRTWFNNEIALPNGIPCVSCTDGLIYGLGYRLVELSKVPWTNVVSFLAGVAPNVLCGVWTLEGIDWWSGKSVMRYSIGSMPLYNSLYSATIIGPDGELVMGTIGGILRVTANPKN